MERSKGFLVVKILARTGMIAVILVGITFILGAPKLHREQMAARELATIREIGMIHQAEMEYNTQFGRYATNLAELGVPDDGKRTGYILTLTGAANGYNVRAVPEKFGQTGRRTFYSDQSPVTRNNWTAELTTVTSPEIK